MAAFFIYSEASTRPMRTHVCRASTPSIQVRFYRPDRLYRLSAGSVLADGGEFETLSTAGEEPKALNSSTASVRQCLYVFGGIVEGAATNTLHMFHIGVHLGGGIGAGSVNFFGSHRYEEVDFVECVG